MNLPPLNTSFTYVASGSPFVVPENYHYLPIPDNLNGDLAVEYLYIDDNIPAVICLRMGSEYYRWTGYVLKEFNCIPNNFHEGYSSIIDYEGLKLDPTIRMDQLGSHIHRNMESAKPYRVAPNVYDGYNFFPFNLIYVYGTSLDTGVNTYDVDNPYLIKSKDIIIEKVTEMNKILTMFNIIN